ncbi:hypothetical protein TNCV_1307501 [Trichonephila clavipes]|nr:hypothetical protein TNCV_1307501 [Trichonephila clavipes]
MFFEGTPHNDNVIKINQAGLVRKSSKDCFHNAVECYRGIAQAERHNLKLTQSLSRGEGSFLFIVRVEFYLPIPALEILGRKPGIAGKCVKRVIDSWQRIAVLFRNVIQPTIIHAESDKTIFLLDQNDGKWPGT